jgi:hypothetical protein
MCWKDAKQVESVEAKCEGSGMIIDVGKEQVVSIFVILFHYLFSASTVRIYIDVEDETTAGEVGWQRNNKFDKNF